MYFRCWLAITERGGAADDNSAGLIAAPRDGFKRSCDKVANRVSFYINPVQRERGGGGGKGERLYNLGRREGEAVFSLQTCYLEICPVYLRVCTRANSEFTIDLSRHVCEQLVIKLDVEQPTVTYSILPNVLLIVSLSLLARFRAMASSPERRKSNLREE